MKDFDLHTLQLELQDLNNQLAKIKAAEKKAALATFKEQVAQYDITQQEVLSALGYVQKKRKRTAAKYYDASSGRSWSGRGHGRNGSKERNSMTTQSIVRRNPGGQVKARDVGTARPSSNESGRPA